MQANNTTRHMLAAMPARLDSRSYLAALVIVMCLKSPNAEHQRHEPAATDSGIEGRPERLPPVGSMLWLGFIL